VSTKTNNKIGFFRYSYLKSYFSLWEDFVGRPSTLFFFWVRILIRKLPRCSKHQTFTDLVIWETITQTWNLGNWLGEKKGVKLWATFGSFKQHPRMEMGPEPVLNLSGAKSFVFMLRAVISSVIGIWYGVAASGLYLHNIILKFKLSD